MKLDKLLIPISILLWCIIIGVSMVFIQIEKQDSIEYQKRLDIKLERDIFEAKTTKDNREYIAGRKKDCLEIYKNEGVKWNNTTSYNYIEYTDICSIEYKNDKWKIWEDITGKYFTKEF